MPHKDVLSALSQIKRLFKVRVQRLQNIQRRTLSNNVVP